MSSNRSEPKVPSKPAKGEIPGLSRLQRAEGQQWYRLIVENVRDFAIFSADCHGKINSWNPGAERFFQYRAEEILGEPMERVYTPEDQATGVAEKERTTALAKGTCDDERWHLRKDGSRFFVLGTVAPMKTDNGEHCGFIKVARDITPRKELQKRLESSEELHRLILQNIQDFAIITLDMEGKIETWNTGAEKTFGYSSSEIVGKNLAILYTAEERASGAPERLLAEVLKGTQSREEFWCVGRAGRRIFVTAVTRPIRDENGSIRGFCKVARDITARQELQNELERTQADLEQLVEQRTARLTETVHELETFSYSLSHDMRAPLRAMQGFAEIILENHAAQLPEDANDLLKRISSSAYRLDHLIKESLAYYRTPQGPLPVQPTDLEPVLHTLALEHLGLANLDTDTLVVERPLVPVMAHVPSLVQALGNFLENAIRFVPPDRQPRVRIRTQVVDGQVRVCVQDNGIGIAPPEQAKVWNLFTRLHPERFAGTGIGLALVRKATERMGGTVGVESEEGKGSTFWLQLQAPPVQ